MSNLAAEDFIKDQKVLSFDFEEMSMYRNLYIVRNKEMYISKSALKFIKFIREFFSNEPKQLRIQIKGKGEKMIYLDNAATT